MQQKQDVWKKFLSDLNQMDEYKHFCSQCLVINTAASFITTSSDGSVTDEYVSGCFQNFLFICHIHRCLFVPLEFVDLL